MKYVKLHHHLIPEVVKILMATKEWKALEAADDAVVAAERAYGETWDAIAALKKAAREQQAALPEAARLDTLHILQEQIRDVCDALEKMRLNVEALAFAGYHTEPVANGFAESERWVNARAAILKQGIVLANQELREKFPDNIADLKKELIARASLLDDARQNLFVAIKPLRQFAYYRPPEEE